MEPGRQSSVPCEQGVQRAGRDGTHPDREPGVGGAQADVAGRNDVDAEPDAKAVDGGDDGHAAGGDAADGVLEVLSGWRRRLRCEVSLSGRAAGGRLQLARASLLGQTGELASSRGYASGARAPSGPGLRAVCRGPSTLGRSLRGEDQEALEGRQRRRDDGTSSGSADAGGRRRTVEAGGEALVDRARQDDAPHLLIEVLDLLEGGPELAPERAREGVDGRPGERER